MLVLTRKQGEGVAIGGEIVVKVLEVEGDRVRIGIEAPQAMKVLRMELYDEIRGENRKAVDLAPGALEEIFKTDKT